MTRARRLAKSSAVASPKPLVPPRRNTKVTNKYYNYHNDQS